MIFRNQDSVYQVIVVELGGMYMFLYNEKLNWILVKLVVCEVLPVDEDLKKMILAFSIQKNFFTEKRHDVQQQFSIMI